MYINHSQSFVSTCTFSFILCWEREREGGVVFVYFFAYHYNLTVYESRVVFSYYAWALQVCWTISMPALITLSNLCSNSIKVCTLVTVQYSSNHCTMQLSLQRGSILWFYYVAMVGVIVVTMCVGMRQDYAYLNLVPFYYSSQNWFINSLN